jgi:hypothetical protein
MRILTALCILCICASASASIYNLKIVTDANPDYSDLPSLIHSATSKWTTPEEKCWAMFYWNHIARRQTMPIELHGMALTDPIRQFNDYGYTMCSTISGINQSIWEQMGLRQLHAPRRRNPGRPHLPPHPRKAPLHALRPLSDHQRPPFLRHRTRSPRLY